MQEEIQREYGNNAIQTDFVASSVTHRGNSSANGGNGYKFSKSNSGKRPVTGASVVCEVFHLQGHCKDKCFCVHDYPSWHRIFGKPKPKPKHQVELAHAYNVLSENTTNQVSVSNPENESTGFISAQYQQLMCMIQSGFKELSANVSFSSTRS